MLNADAQSRIEAAIADAETRTSGEIYCVVAAESSKYREVPVLWAGGVALLGPPLALLLGLRPAAAVQTLLLVTQSGWAVGQTGAVDAAVTSALVGYAALQAVVFALVMAVVAIPKLRRLLTPGFLKREHVHARAMEQFAHRLHATSAATGVLIYASLAERRVEIVADEAIHRAVEPGAWDQAVKTAVELIRKGDVAEGLVAAIGVCGAALSTHFPDDGAPPAAEHHLAEV